VPVRQEDEFEAARPEKGITIRVRCAWENTPQGFLKQPISELLRLIIDSKELSPVLVSKRRPNGLLDEHYHHVHLENPAAGKHSATAIVRLIATDANASRTVEFTIA
jgi:hypothetical protein